MENSVKPSGVGGVFRGDHIFDQYKSHGFMLIGLSTDVQDSS
jgi:hypothetical protein